MTKISELIEKQQAMNAQAQSTRVAKSAPAKPAPVKRSANIDRLLAAVKDQYENPNWESVDVVLGGELVTIEAAHVWGTDWQEIEDKNPPVTAADRNSGFNRQALPRDYPASRLRVAGEPVDVETWQALFDLLEVPHQLSLSALMWGINVYEPEQDLIRLTAENSARGKK